MKKYQADTHFKVYQTLQARLGSLYDNNKIQLNTFFYIYVLTYSFVYYIFSCRTDNIMSSVFCSKIFCTEKGVSTDIILIVPAEVFSLFAVKWNEMV